MSQEACFVFWAEVLFNQCWPFADLYERQTCIGVIVMTQACCFAEQQWARKHVSVLANLLCISVGQMQTCMKGKLA